MEHLWWSMSWLNFSPILLTACHLRVRTTTTFRPSDIWQGASFGNATLIRTAISGSPFVRARYSSEVTDLTMELQLLRF